MQVQKTHRSRAIMFPVDMFERLEGELSNSSCVLQDGEKYWLKRRNDKWFAEKADGSSINGEVGYSSRERAAGAASAAASKNLHGS